MEEKQTIPVWQWILLGVLGIVLIGTLARYATLSGVMPSGLSVPGMNRAPVQTENEYVPEPTQQPGT